ncbi:MAG: hypothetical protein V7742_17110 [Halioglobus sp.]
MLKKSFTTPGPALEFRSSRLWRGCYALLSLACLASLLLILEKGYLWLSISMALAVVYALRALARTHLTGSFLTSTQGGGWRLGESTMPDLPVEIAGHTVPFCVLLRISALGSGRFRSVLIFGDSLSRHDLCALRRWLRLQG